MADQLLKLILCVALLFGLVSAQESINAHEGFNVGMHCGIALGICFSILATIAVSVNVIKAKCLKKS
jgi:hypothetical protein